MTNDPFVCLAWKLIWMPGLAYLLSWIAVTHYSRLAFGSVTLLWFKLLGWIVAGGLAMLILVGVDRLLETYLFWRR